ncbi:NRDE family protein [Falsiroseomonas selenitidurans]|uniref:NRDE family protein n=1 Tax=Falsiroseomonas selenitidurans TaxID=2716335 RepID=A0ABX1E1F2_9PROT|nr:NRDE family protein [Falsiroseomonas selenitidurans]NKC29577.1 NRDE family protein [Falsiroseomonas selenitidurans]
MCTLILLFRPGHPWPVLVAANRDERLDRPWDAPAAHWPEEPGTVGGRDRSAGGTWMALGATGVLGAVLNRPGSLGPAPGKLSRGALPLLAARQAAAAAAAEAIGRLDAGLYRPFNLVVADHRAAFFLRGLGEGSPQIVPLPPGISMVTAHDPNDTTSPRTRRHLPRFRAAPPPDPDAGDWQGWEALLADDRQGEAGVAETLRVPPTGGFGTVCASLLALGAAGQRLWRFCPAPPGRAAFAPVDLPG